MDQITSQLYSSCNKSAQNSVINTMKNFFSLSEADILREIKTTVTQKSYPGVHRMVCSSMVSPSKTSLFTKNLLLWIVNLHAPVSPSKTSLFA